MIKWINIQFKTRYWYSVRLTYKNKLGQKVFDFTAEVGVVKKSSILNHRHIKKSLKPLHKIKQVPKSLLSNGSYYVEPVCYLGWFKK